MANGDFVSCGFKFMNTIRRIYNDAHRVSAVAMIMALLWLTVCTPFVYLSQQHLAKHERATHTKAPTGNDQQEDNPLTNTSEEKAPNASTSLSEEYIHAPHHTGAFIFAAAQYHTWHAATYTAFHGEMLVPPPNLA